LHSAEVLSVLFLHYGHWAAGTGGHKDYDYTFRRFEAFLKDDPPLTSITIADIRGFLNSLTGISNKTQLNYHTGLSALWTWATKEGPVERNIVRDMIPTKPEQRKVEIAARQTAPFARREKRW